MAGEPTSRRQVRVRARHHSGTDSSIEVSADSGSFEWWPVKRTPTGTLPLRTYRAPDQAACTRISAALCGDDLDGRQPS
jgi:hypothetical protein